MTRVELGIHDDGGWSIAGGALQIKVRRFFFPVASSSKLGKPRFLRRGGGGRFSGSERGETYKQTHGGGRGRGREERVGACTLCWA